MEEKLFEAARTGDVDYLINSMESNPMVLEIIVMNNEDTPLHVASMYGHASFIREIIQQRENLGRELNRDGLSPLHIAAAMGHVEVAKELLKKLGSDICLIKGKERRIPLHYAAMKGKVCVFDELISANPDSLDEVTCRGETALNLAVKHHQFDAFGAFLGHLSQLDKLHLLNKQDNKGNTVLHLAVQRRQFEVIDLLLGTGASTTVPKGLIDVNSRNSSGFTALDVLLHFGGEPGDAEIQEILYAAGAVRAIEFTHSDSNTTQDSTSRSANNMHEQWLDYFKYKKHRDSPDDTRNTLLVIAILIATTTYQAALSPPGGVWQQDYCFGGSCYTDNGENRNSTVVKQYVAGTTVMGSKSWVSYSFFVFLNSVGFFTALQLISLLSTALPFYLELQVSLNAVALTYDFAMAALAPSVALSVFFIVLSVILPIFISKVPNLIRKCIKKPRSPQREGVDSSPGS